MTSEIDIDDVVIDIDGLPTLRKCKIVKKFEFKFSLIFKLAIVSTCFLCVRECVEIYISSIVK